MNMDIKRGERITLLDELIYSRRTLQKAAERRPADHNHPSASLLDQSGIAHKLKSVPQSLLGV
jgi:hypothetical protein